MTSTSIPTRFGRFLRDCVSDRFFPKQSQPLVISIVDSFFQSEEIQLASTLSQITTLRWSGLSFEQSLHTALEDVEALIQDDLNENREFASDATKEKYYLFIGELTNWAVRNVKDFTLPKSNQRLVNFVKHTLEFFHSPGEKTRLKDIEKDLEKIIDQKKACFCLEPLTPENEQIIINCKNILKEFNELPPSLQELCYNKSIGFKSNIPDILALMTSAYKIVDEGELLAQKYEMSIQEERNPVKAIQDLSLNALEALSLPAQKKITFSIFRQFWDALSYLENNGEYTQEQKTHILDHIRSICQSQCEGFLAEATLEDIAQTKDLFENALQQFCNTNGIEHEDLEVEQLLTSLEKERIALHKEPAVLGTQEKNKSLLTYFSSIFELGSENVIKLFSSVLYQNILTSSYFKKWKESQNEQTQAIIASLTDKLKAAYEKAQETQNIADYKKIFTEFMKEWSQHQITLNGLDLGKLFEEPEVKDARAAQLIHSSETLKTLKTCLNTEKISLERESVDPAAALEAEKKSLISNLRKYGIFQFVSYFLPKEDKDRFPNLIAAETAILNEAQKEKFFKKEIKKIINESKKSWITKKLALWLLLPAVEVLAEKFSKRIIENVLGHVNDVFEDFNKDLFLQRIQNSLSKYNKLLDHWAHLKEGGDKRSVIHQMMKKKDFLSFEGESYSEQMLYKKATEHFVEKYINIYPTDGPEAAFSAKCSRKKYDLLKHRSLFISIPSFIVLSLIQINSSILENIHGRFVKFLVKKTLGSLNLFSSGVSTVREKVFEKNPYVYAVTSFVADQFEILCRELDSPDQSEESIDDVFEVSDRTKSLMKSNLQHLFEILKKNSFETQDALKKHLENKEDRANKFFDTLDESVILPLLEDGISDLAAVAYSKLLNKKNLDQPLATLCQNINDSLTSRSVDDPAILEEKSMQAQQKLKFYSDKILEKIISKGIQEVITPKQEKSVKSFMNWLNSTLNSSDDSLKNKWTELLNEFTQSERDQEQDLPQLKKLLTQHRTFLTEFEVKLEGLHRASASSYSEIMEKISPVIENFKTLTEKLQSLIGHKEKVSQLDSALPFYSASRLAFEAIQKLDFNQANAKEEFIQKYALLDKLIQEINPEQAQQIEENKSKVIKDFDSITQLQSLEREIEATTAELIVFKNDNLGTLFSRRKDPLQTRKFKELTAKIRVCALPPAVKDELISCIQDHIARDVALDLSCINEAKVNLQRELEDRCSQLITLLQNGYHSICGKISTSMRERALSKESIEVILDSTREESLSEILERFEAISNIELPKFAHLKALPASLKTGGEQLIYATLKPKITAALNLIRDENFDQFLVNHAVVMPFLKK